jgi:uncharacterized protein (DUF58 family)
MDWIEEAKGLSPVEKNLMQRNRIRYILLVGGVFIYAFFFGGFFPYTLLYLVLGLPLMSFFALALAHFQFKINERLNSRVFTKGERAAYQLQMNNDSIFLMPYVTVHMYMEGQTICSSMRSMRISLPPLSKREFTYDIPLRYRGRYTIGVRHIEIQDVLGIFRLRIHTLENKSILVKPRIQKSSYMHVPSAMVSEGNTTAGLYEQGQDETVNIREYRVGDSLRNMHWKLYAKMCRPMIRELKNELDNDILFLVNLDKPNIVNESILQKEDCLVESIVSAAHHLILRGLPVRLCYYREEPMVVRAQTPGDFMKIYETLSEMKFKQNIPFQDIMSFFVEASTEKTMICIYTMSLTGAIMDQSLIIKNRGYDLELTYIDLPDRNAPFGTDSDNLTDLLLKNGITAYHIHPEPLEMDDAKPVQKKFSGGVLHDAVQGQNN